MIFVVDRPILYYYIEIGTSADVARFGDRERPFMANSLCLQSTAPQTLGLSPSVFALALSYPGIHS